MLKLAFGLVVFLLISQVRAQDVVIESTPIVLAPVADERIEVLQQQLQQLQSQMIEMNQQRAVAPAPVVEAPQVPVQAPILAPEPRVQPALAPTLRGRKQSLSWRYSYNYEKHKMTTSDSSVSVTNDGNRTEFEFEYALNLSFIEGGVRMLGIRAEDDSGDELLQSDFALVGRLNFIENRPGNDFIPYLSGYLGGVTVEYRESTTWSLEGGYVGIGVGFNWFPFSEIFALNLELSHFSAGLESDTYPKITTDSIATKLNVGWRLYF